jgi:hypothetical protein
MLSAAQRQAKLARKKKARKQRAAENALNASTEAMIREAHHLIVVDKLEELYGQGADGYTQAQRDHVKAIMDAYTPEDFGTAFEQATALSWETDDIDDDEDWYPRRVAERRQQGRGHP